MKCEICGVNEATTQAIIPLWSYGKRKSKLRNVCKSCKKAHQNGNL